MSRSNLCDIDVHIHHKTDKAYLVSLDGDREKAVWIPKSACEMEKVGAFWQITLPEPLALEKGLI